MREGTIKTTGKTVDWTYWTKRIATVTRAHDTMGLTEEVVRRFRHIVMDYYRRHGRHELAWRHTTDPYHILISEIMLQQTQVARVALKYPVFIREFPDIKALASAPLRNVIAGWQGMGYNRRALALKKTARILVRRYQGRVPDTVEILEVLPGIGHATACALCAFAYNKPVPFIETNIRTVFLYVFFPRTAAVSDRDVIPLVEATIIGSSPRVWFQALMDFGVFIKKHTVNPGRRSMVFKKQSAFRGSDREIRGAVVRLLTRTKEISREKITLLTKCPKKRLYRVLSGLERDGLIEVTGSLIRIAE